jgi:hypothetical protein
VTEAGLDPVQYKAPEEIRVQPPVPHDGTRGYILSRSLEVHGRPVSFAFTGNPPDKDGAEVILTPARLRKSLNYERRRFKLAMRDEGFGPKTELSPASKPARFHSWKISASFSRSCLDAWQSFLAAAENN